MCGIAGVVNLADHPAVSRAVIESMLGAIRHRGPDESGIYRDGVATLGSVRLSILDLAGGRQPIGNEDGTLWIVFNGEVFNYLDLVPQLLARGHRLATKTDTEVVLHLYEDLGPACLQELNGQFALAIWDTRDRSLFMARDRLGVRPLFYALVNGKLIFGSEIKSILASGEVHAEIDPHAISQALTFWSILSPHTAFRNIQELPAAHYLQAGQGHITVHRYWSLDFAENTARPAGDRACLEEFEALLIDAIRMRLRADVPVGAYLSGGLDSAVTASIVRQHTASPLDTFSIEFDDAEFDESRFQQQMAAFLGARHHRLRCSSADIGQAFIDATWHTETPVLRTAPAPMYLLSGLVHQAGFKVVVTGEGADEILAGYDLFKEMQIRRWWAQQPDSPRYPSLLRRLYPDIAGFGSIGDAYLAAFFGRNLQDTGSPFYSHHIRWHNTGRIRRFLVQSDSPAADPEANGLREALPPGFCGWSSLAQAQYLEVITFLSTYLLSSQGDRVAMAHGVEGRFPFLDHRVVEFCNRLPAAIKMRGLTEKWLLKQLGRSLVPAAIWQRPKRPYRAPIQRSLLAPGVADCTRELLAAGPIETAGLFKPAAVAQLLRKAESPVRLSEVEEMALAGILSSQLLDYQFVRAFRPAPALFDPQSKLIDRVN